MRTPFALLSCSASFCFASAAAAQDPAPAAAPAPASAPALPAAGSPEATALFEKACAKMLALGRGKFSSSEEQDPAIMRGHNLPFGNNGTDVNGGWQGDTVWASTGDDEYVMHYGRLVSKTHDSWRVRGNRLASGTPLPFTLQPPQLFALLQQLPDHKPGHVEAGEVGPKQVAILTLTLTGGAASDFANSGVLPATSSGPMLNFGGGADLPEKTYTVDLALSVDPQNGDVHRLRAKVYEDDPMLANVHVQIGGGGGGGEQGDDDDKKEKGKDKDKDAAKGGGTAMKKGLPDRKPGKTESVMYYKVDFKSHGLADPPALDDGARSWLLLK